jgi:type III pantothenate kinase
MNALLTIDIGNTSIGLALFVNSKIVQRNKIYTPHQAIEKSLAELFAFPLQKAPLGIAVSSVVPGIDDYLDRYLQQQFTIKPYFINFCSPHELSIKISHPEEIGADRIADAVGALDFFSPPYIVIDSGTATTFDIVNQHQEYIGGAIFPGVSLALRSLYEHTAKLPKVEFSVPKSILGTDTISSIQAGIYYSYIGSLTFMIAEYKKMLGGSARVIVTGGLSEYFKNRLADVDLYEPDLLFYGLKRLFAQRNGL